MTVICTKEKAYILNREHADELSALLGRNSA